MRKLICLLLASLLTLPLWAQYNPDNPGDPDVYYNLTLECQPAAGGSVSPAKRQVPEGGVVTCKATANEGYRFVQWMEGGYVLSTDPTLDYEMPNEDVTLTAVFQWMPDNPEDPNGRGYSHKVLLYASPAGAGYFDSDTRLVVEGDTAHVYAHARDGFLFDAWLSNDTVVSVENPITILMGTEDMALTARFTYAPNDPKEPGFLYWETVTEFSSPSFRVTLDTNGGTAQYFSNYYRLGKGGSLTLTGKSNVDRIVSVKMNLQDPARCGNDVRVSAGTLVGDSIIDVDDTSLTITATGSWPQLWLTSLEVTYEGTAPYGTYAVRLPQYLAHGTVTANYDWANEGDEVTLTATPDEGYHLSLLYANRGAVTLSPSAAASNAYTFTMPAEDVAIGAVFAEGDITTGLRLNVPEDTEASSNAATPIYNLQGQRVRNAQRGVYIVGGRKVVH